MAKLISAARSRKKFKIFSTTVRVRLSLAGFSLQTAQMNKMIRPLRSQSLAAIALLIFGTTARLHAVEALLLQDAYVDNKNNSNLGSNGNLRVTKSGNQVCRSFLKFSLATLPAGITATNVTEARLRLWVDSSSNTLGSITMTPVTSAWDEFTITNTTSGGLILCLGPAARPSAEHEKTPCALLKELSLMGASLAIAAAGILLAYQLYRTKRIAPELVAAKWPRLYQLLLHKYYVDEIYDAAVVDRTKDLGTGLGWLDANVIDGVGVNGAGWLARCGSTLSMWWDKWIIDGLLNFSAKLMQLFSYPVRLLQTGVFSSYAMLILVGLVILLAYYGHHMQVLLRGVR